MPIAVSAIVRPSRIHRFLTIGAGLSLFAAACAVGFFAPQAFQGSLFQAVLLAGAGATLMHAGSRKAKTHRIDISGTGDVVLTVQQGLRKPGVASTPENGDRAAGVALMPGSVVWPFLMLLRFRDDTARMHVLPLWRDSLGSADWRLLVVAVLAIGRRGGHNAGCEKSR